MRTLAYGFGVVLGCAIFGVAAHAQTGHSSLATDTMRQVAIIPEPASIKPGKGEFAISAKTRIVALKGTRDVAEQLRDALQPATGFPLDISSGGGANAVILSLDSKLKRLGPEGYRLEVVKNAVRVRAFQPAGLFYGVQTLRQLLPAEIFRRSRVAEMDWIVPAVEIEDVPRFSWRGAHLDVARHFMPKEFVLKFIDLMALHKLNVFHWHLVDDQGWRVEIKKYPKLTEVGGKTDFTTFNPIQPMQPVSLPQGGYYTQDDIREVVRYAADRFITVVPEIEMPGHSSAAIAAYPQIGNRGEIAAAGIDPNTVPSVDEVYNVDDSTIHFLQDVLSEVMGLFPSKFIHIGGDEVDKHPWRANPMAQQRMQALHLANGEQLQAWFVRQMDDFLTEHGRRLVGWDEILEGGVAAGATVMSWRGTNGGVAAARAGHDVVMAPEDVTYLDHYQWMVASDEPRAIGGFLPLEKMYGFDPIPPELTADEAKHILGGQTQLWSEYIPQQKQMEYMAYPRMCALAEAVWSPKESRNWRDFMARMRVETERLSILDVHFRPITPLPAAIAQWQGTAPMIAAPAATSNGPAQDGSASAAQNPPRPEPAPFAQQEWDVSSAISAPGTYTVAFAQTGGSGSLNIEWVELRANGELVARITRPGSSDTRDRSNSYDFAVATASPGTKYTLIASIRATGLAVGAAPPTGDLYVLPR
jgi:hexosaminidase